MRNNFLWCTKWLQNAILNVLASFERIRTETIFSSSEWVVMHQMASECNSERFSKFWAHSERKFVLAQNELWCTKCLQNAILNVLASFESIRCETIFSSSEWVVMHQMASECNSERFSKFWAHSVRNNFFELRMSCDAPNGFRMQFWTF